MKFEWMKMHWPTEDAKSARDWMLDAVSILSIVLHRNISLLVHTKDGHVPLSH